MEEVRPEWGCGSAFVSVNVVCRCFGCLYAKILCQCQIGCISHLPHFFFLIKESVEGYDILNRQISYMVTLFGFRILHICMCVFTLQEEGELIIEGLLNISWGLRRPIRLQMQDDHERIRPPPSSTSWHSGCNLDNQRSDNESNTHRHKHTYLHQPIYTYFSQNKAEIKLEENYFP